jgi:uncharacterized protein
LKVLLVRILPVLALLYGALCVVVFLARDRLVFPIRGGPAGDPARFGLADGLAVMMPTGDGAQLGAWLLPGPPGARAPVVVWFHGNGETVAALAPVLREFRPADAALLAVEFRGYGSSTGTPTVAAAERDADVVWRWLAARADLDSTRVVVYGRSIGSGPATLLAATHPVAGLVLESPFTSLRAMARVHYPFLPSALAGSRFDNLARITATTCPVLIIHGDRDGIIPTEEGRALAQAAGARAEFWAIPGADHNETYDAGGDEYVRRFKAFVTRVVAR